jgi:UDP-N-acetylmuramoylalanine--D-glutamate ligase
MDIDGKRFTVVGAGKSGMAAANAISRRGGDVRLVESRPNLARPAGLEPKVHFAAGTNAVRSGDVAVLSPGIPEVSPLRQQVAAVATEVIGEVELFYRLCPSPIIAITGTDGKSTTTTMIGDIFSASGRKTFVGGNLGNPLCEGLDDASLDPKSVVVAEISAFQLTTCHDFRPHVAVVTNIAEDHLDYHGGYEPYQAAKRGIWRQMATDDVLILNRDDAEIAAWTLPAAPTIRWFSLTKSNVADAYFHDGVLWLKGDHGSPQELMKRNELPLLGEHNVANALAATLAAHAMNIDLQSIRTALRGIKALPHRLQSVATHGGVSWVNDSKATNPNAAMAGIKAIDTPLILLAGGSTKEADFTSFTTLARKRARTTIVFGQTRHAIAAAFDDGNICIVETLQEAVKLAHRHAVEGDTVLLSPACASFDQFKSYGHRGDVFRELVEALYS